MELSEEQKQIVETEGNIVVDAVAGSGKTTVSLEYTKARPDKKFLYTCFNRSVRDYAEQKFGNNVEVKNIHSLAYRETGAFQWELAKSFDIFDVIDILKIKKKRGEKNHHAKLAGHILNGLNLYFSCGIKDIKDFDYQQFNGRTFADSNADQIKSGIEKLNSMMLTGKIPIVHNFYLKQFQISEPELDYDCIIYDEAQDANACMLDVLNYQNCQKVVTGDRFQAIYRWNLAENALDSFGDDFQVMPLHQSFRFRQDVAELAKQIVGLKEHLGMDTSDFEIKGIGSPNKLDTSAYLARSNMQLIGKAADVVSSTRKTIHFEGNINSYMFAEGVGLYDIFFLWQGDKTKVKNKTLSQFDSFREYEEFLEEVGSRDQQILCNLVKKYKGSIFKVIKEIKNRNVEKEDADIVLSTVHKAKGIEYDTVELAPDFVKESDLMDYDDGEEDRLNEEINILYVAATRVANKLDFPSFYLNNYPELNESKL